MLLVEEHRALDVELSGLDALELSPAGPRVSAARRVWRASWPKLCAIALAIVLWQAVVLSGWKPEYVLPGPLAVWRSWVQLIGDGALLRAVGITMARAAAGFGVACVVGVVVGAAVSQVAVLRAGVGALITGLQTMPSIAWFPLAILLFQLSEQAVLFVVVLGAAPAIANGLISGADQIPPILLRAGTVLGARGFARLRHVVLPASLPSFIGGLKQGWAFAWRSLMAGELLVVLAGRPSLGFLLQLYRELSRTEALLAVMATIMVIGLLVDTVVFGTADRWVRRRYGLVDVAAA
jgi:NitT/TauT family transport system permease protein